MTIPGMKPVNPIARARLRKDSEGKHTVEEWKEILNYKSGYIIVYYWSRPYSEHYDIQAYQIISWTVLKCILKSIQAYNPSCSLLKCIWEPIRAHKLKFVRYKNAFKKPIIIFLVSPISNDIRARNWKVAGYHNAFKKPKITPMSSKPATDKLLGTKMHSRS